MSAPGLLRATLTLLAGGALAQLLPLLLGPWLTRLYSPQVWGEFHLFWAVAANLAVVACARYEFALPMVRDDAEARTLRALCLRVLAGTVALSTVGAVVWWWLQWHPHGASRDTTEGASAYWMLWLPLAVGALGGISLATLWATRQQAFKALALARVLQHGGAAVGQVLAGLASMGVHGLIVAPVAAAGAAWIALRRAAPAASGRQTTEPPLPVSTAPLETGDHATARPSATPHPTDRAASAETHATLLPTPPAHWRSLALRYRDFPLLNTPHAFAGALQDTLALAMIAATLGPAAAGFWGLSMRYLKAPATLVGSAVSQALYPQLASSGVGGQIMVTAAARAAVVRVMGLLAALALPLVASLWWLGPWAFERAFGAPWREAGELSRALALYIGVHFIASPLAVVTMAWGAQRWALQLAAIGQTVFVAALWAGLHLGAAPSLAHAGWAVSLAMAGYFGYYFWRLARWPLGPVASSPVASATMST